MIQEHLTQIHSLQFGMDIVILSVTSPQEELFWQERLNLMRGQVLQEHTRILTVYEDWEGGAGNALGTLYSFIKANQKMQEIYQEDLLDRLDQGDSIALYHTAGKGTRLAPLPGSEYNSKSRIKLVGKLIQKKEIVPITLLEAILKQTSIFAPKRQGRLSVFWGDQLFIPEREISKTSCEIDLLVKLLPEIPDEETWSKEHYDQYGLVIVDKEGSFKQLEKLNYARFQKQKINLKNQVGLSLGSFSLSKNFLSALLKEFSLELQQKKGKMDTDPHLWMPLTLDENTYLSIFENKGFCRKKLQAHHQRLQNFKKSFENSKKLLGTTNLGDSTLWWDYGNSGSFLKNHLKSVQSTQEGEFMRRFFSLSLKPENEIKKTSLTVENSVLINCSIESGSIQNSVLINVVAKEAHIQNSVLIETIAPKIDAKDVILYNVLESESLTLKNYQVRADVFLENNEHFKLYNSIISPISWDQPAKENPFSFAQLHQFNEDKTASIGQLSTKAAKLKIKQAVIHHLIQN